MKFVLILACLVLFVAQSQGQRPRPRECRGAVPTNRTICTGPRSSGTNRRNNPTCLGNANNEMWWYDSRARQCKTMRYRGCGGNFNRYCSKAACERKCRGRRPN